MNERFDRVDKELNDLRDDLADAVRSLTNAVLSQADATKNTNAAITRLADRFDLLMQATKETIPIRMVFIMFVIVILCIGGVEAIKAAPKFLGVM